MYTYVIIDDEPLIRRGTKKKLEPLSHLLTCCGVFILLRFLQGLNQR